MERKHIHRDQGRKDCWLQGEGLRRLSGSWRRAYLLCMLSGFLAFMSCNIDADLKECPYNARLEYWYTGSGSANVLPDYIYTMREFVFDSLGVLRQVNEIAAKKGIAAELNVPPGKYTLVTWANIDSASHVNQAEIGHTTKEEMRLYMDNPYKVLKSESAVHGNAERLYYGFATFYVNNRGVTRQRMDMTHSHCLLNLTVKWKYNPPRDTKNFCFYLLNVPSEVRFLPGYEVRGSASMPYQEPEYPATRSGSSNYIPLTSDGQKLVDQRLDVKMDITRTLSGEFVTYRLTNDTHPVLRICAGETLLVREIDLNKYFRQMDIDLDQNLRQEFNLIVEVDGDKVFVSSARVSDWIDGGVIGGVL